MTTVQKAIVADMRKVSNKLRSKVTRSKYRNLGSYASSTVESHFGSWSRAVAKV